MTKLFTRLRELEAKATLYEMIAAQACADLNKHVSFVYGNYHKLLAAVDVLQEALFTISQDDKRDEYEWQLLAKEVLEKARAIADSEEIAGE